MHTQKSAIHVLYRVYKRSEISEIRNNVLLS